MRKWLQLQLKPGAKTDSHRRHLLAFYEREGKDAGLCTAASLVEVQLDGGGTGPDGGLLLLGRWLSNVACRFATMNACLKQVLERRSLSKITYERTAPLAWQPLLTNVWACLELEPRQGYPRGLTTKWLRWQWS